MINPQKSGGWGVEQVRLFVKDALCLYSELCFLPERGAQFQKIHEKQLLESEKCTQKTLDGEFDAYVCGLGGAEK